MDLDVRFLTGAALICTHHMPDEFTEFRVRFPLTETVLLGNVAYRTGERIEWDSANMNAANTNAADR
jgi:hypothetical protein